MLDFIKIAEKWQKEWEKHKVFYSEADKRKKFYVAIVYPYMSGLLHLGHLFTYTNSEVILRYKRMRGFNVLAKFAYHCTGTPIIAAAQRVKEKEPSQIETLKKMGIDEKEIPKFADPEYWCEYFPRETLKDAKNMGFAIDERYAFRTTYLNPPYDRFITWQFNKLHEKGLVKKGKHPVVWCPKDNVPVGDHDRAEGEGETPQEFLLFKHKLENGSYILTATLRHDTILGITNIFIHPELVYLKAKVGNETWIIGEKAADMLKYQGYGVEVIGNVKGSELIGKETLEFDGNKVPILPADFLDPKIGTGIVHSVPSDSPDDLIALKELQENSELLNNYGLDSGKIRKIKPIPVLNTPEYGDIPAAEMLKKYKITSQKQRDKLENAKKEIYRISHYTATFNSLYRNKFSKNLEGKKVEEGKDVIKNELIEKGFALRFYELTGKVVCRCLTECIIKMVEDQWFIEYNDPEWKKKAHECLDSMKIYPEVVRKQFDYVIDWLDHWACTREYGLGTKLPWDHKWVIESLSDSTIQMAYGTISKYLQNPKEYGFMPDRLNDEFFDYVFLGIGNSESVEKSAGIPKKIVETMRSDFEYWYPFDFRNSAKDLVQNHLTFCIFNHVALFPKKHWPRAFMVNGRIMVNNEKMSKSKGNFFTMRELYLEHGPDIVRIAAANAGEGIDDANYDMEFLETAKKKLTELHEFIKDNYNKGRESELTIDKWFESKISESVKKTTDAMESMFFKSAINYSLMDMQRNLKWYLKRTNNKPSKRLAILFSESIIRMLAPFTPHFCEECWHEIGKKSFVSNEKWCEADLKAINSSLDYSEDLIRNTMSDIREVLKLAKIQKPRAISLFIAPSWKYELFTKANELVRIKNASEILKELLQDKKFSSHGQDVSRFLPKMLAERKLPSVSLSQMQEISVLTEALDFIKSEFGCEIIVEDASLSGESKARQALPGKPALLVEP